MKILVTGGAGFIGSHITDRLINDGHKVVVIDNLSSGCLNNINKKARFYYIDICNPLIHDIFKKEQPMLVIHHAAQVDVKQSLKNPIQDATINIIGSINILQNCIKYRVKKIIYASSAAVYGEPLYLGLNENHPLTPISCYGLSKLAAEQYLYTFNALYRLKYTILRYSNVYGPRQEKHTEGGVVSVFFDNLRSNKQPEIFGDGTQTRDFIYVADIVDAAVQAFNLADNEIINVSTNTPTSILFLLDTMKKLCRSDIEPVFRAEQKGDIKHSYLNNHKARKLLQWEPAHSIQSGLNETLQYYLNNTVFKDDSTTKSKNCFKQ